MLVSILSIVIGCSTKQITETALVGTWHERSSKIPSKPSDAVFRFAADHTFTAENIPYHLVFVSDGSEKKLISGEGTWKLDRAAGFQTVKLSFSRIDTKPNGFDMRILIDVIGGEVRLFFWEEEEGGKRFEFVRNSG